MDRSSQDLQSDGVFSRPLVPGLNGLPRERAHRHSGGAECKPIRIKTEVETDLVKLEPCYRFDNTDKFAPPPGPPMVRQRRESLPADYHAYVEYHHHQTDFEPAPSSSLDLAHHINFRGELNPSLGVEISLVAERFLGAERSLAVERSLGAERSHLPGIFHPPVKEELPEMETVAGNDHRYRPPSTEYGGPGFNEDGAEISEGNGEYFGRNEGTTSSRTVIEFDGNDCVLCRVCGDKASGFHYGVHSCEGCKGFFRRSIQQKIQYRPCSKNQQCSILRINRNRCQYCRLKKCIAAGMSRDAVRFGRVPKREKAKIMAAMQSSKAKIMESRVLAEMSDDRKIIDTIVRAHYDTCDYTAEKIKPFILKAQAAPRLTQCTGQTCPMKGGPEQSFLDEFSDRFMDHVRQVCTFAKCIPGFKCLQHDDQVTLLKSCVFEVLTVRLSGLFDNQSLVCLNGDVIRRETISAMPAGNAKFLMDSVFELAQRINRFRLSDAEIGLFCSVVIITADRPGLRNPELVGRMQTKLKMVLENILVPQHLHHTTIFSELLTIVHDLRTLNTLHTEKFLQQAKVLREEVQASTSPSSIHSHLSYERGDWEDNNMDGDSTGSRSPQSSDSPATTHSFSMEDLRRSPMGSVSSSESLGSSDTFSKLSVNDLRIHGVGSVLLNALTSPALSQVGGNLSRKREISRLSDPLVRSQEESNVPSGSSDQKCPFKARKLDSPSDSGIDSPKAQGSQSTNTSVCSSPRSSMEEAQAGEEDRQDTLEEQHPLLKRALQQPPQPFNMGGGVSMFQDEVYKPHKKFRHSGRRDNDEPSSSTQDGAGSSPTPSLVHQHSILASQLAAPPSYSQPPRRSPPPASQSLLATTLSRPVSVPRAKFDEERSELLANLILDSGRYRPIKNQSLLMCAPLPAHYNIPEGPWSPQSAPRHIPVPVAPTQPTSTVASPRTVSTSRPVEPPKTSQLRSALTDALPLNLSVRTLPPQIDSAPEREKAY